MLKKVQFVLLGILVFSLCAYAADLSKSALAGKSDDILFTDVDNDGDPDIMERWWNGRRCRWFDENDNMTKADQLGDIVSDCLQVDMDGDGTYDGQVDMSVKWADNDKDGKADVQIIVINPKAGEEKRFGGAAHYMVWEDVDRDGVMGYLDWSKFDFPCWRHTGDYNFSPDYNGDSIFLKIHMAPFAVNDARFNWENPFAFYDLDDDGCSEMTIRCVDNATCNGKLDSVYVCYDLDNDSQRDNEQDYELSLRMEKNEVFDYTKYANKYPDVKAPAWTLPYFQRTEWRVIDEFCYIPHDKCYDEAFDIAWGNCLFVFDEDDDDHRWERVELYYPNDPYSLREKNSYSAKRDGNKTPANIHPQTDSLGDRGEFDTDFSGKGKLYVSQWDGRIHLYGAEWGVWTIDSEAKYNGAAALPSGCSDKIAKELETVVLYYDTNQNGFFDLIEFDYDADRIPDQTVSLLEYGSDEFDLIDPADAKWQGMHETFKAMAKKSWKEAYPLYVEFWKTGLSNKSIDDLSFASSTWEKYFHGAKLKQAIYSKLAENLKGDVENLKKLNKYYFTGDFDAFTSFIGTLDFSKTPKSEFTFTVKNPASILRVDELVSIPMAKLKGLDTDSFVVVKDGQPLPSQTDDVDFDGIPDAVIFLADIKPLESFKIQVSSTDKPVQFAKRAHAEISVSTSQKESAGTGEFVDHEMFKRKKNLFRMPGNKSSAYRYEGPLIESDKVAYRLYWDHRGATDVFGKISEAFLGDAHTHKVSHHTMQSWGRDLLHNGPALGVGGLGIGSGDERFSPGKAEYAKIIIGTDGPIKSSCRLVYNDFDYKGQKCSLTWDISMSAGQRYMTHTVNVTSSSPLPMLAALTNHSDESKLTELDNLSGRGINYYATYGDQVFADSDPAKDAVSDEMMGLALLWNSSDTRKTEETELEYRAIFKPAKDVKYYSLAAYNKEFGGNAIMDAKQFKTYMDDLSVKIENPIEVK